MKSHTRRWGGALVVIKPVEMVNNELVILYDSHLLAFVSITTLVIGAPPLVYLALAPILMTLLT